MTEEQRQRLYAALERVRIKVKNLHKEHPEIALGTTGAPVRPGYVEDDPQRFPVNTEWLSLLEPEYSAMTKIVREILAVLPRPGKDQMAKLTPENLWVWGGPTPSWGGSMADDTLVRGAQYYNARNVVYVYGPTNEKMIKLHAGFDKVLCQINSNCRTEGAQGNMNDEANAELLSKLSLQFSNIKGAMCDDVTANYTYSVLPEAFEARYRGLKKYNQSLKMYGVVYVHELEKDFSLALPYMDVVNLWFWNIHDVLEYDKYLQLVMQRFPGKKVLQGIFLHEYGISDAGNLPDLLCYQLDKAREYMAKGIVEGVVILGDREIKKWPDTAEAVRSYLQKQ